MLASSGFAYFPSGAIARSGNYCGQSNPTASTQNCTMGGIDSDGKAAELGRTGATYITFYMKNASYPTSTMGAVRFRDAAGNEIVRINMSTTGALTLVGTTTSASAGTLPDDSTWHRIEVLVTSNGTCSLSYDDGTAETVTGNNFTFDRIIFGNTSSNTHNTLFDDVVIDDAEFITDPIILLSKPIGSGNYSQWTNGSGSTFAVVDEVPPNGASDYLQETSGTNEAHTFNMQDWSTIGGTNSIKSVKAFLTMAETSSTTTSGGVRFRSGSTDVDTGTTDLGSTTYVSREAIHNVDPATSAAWTTSGFDGIEVGPLKGADSSSIRCSSVYAMVLTVGAEAAILALSTAAGLSGATLVVSTAASLALSSAPGVATVSNLLLQSPTMLTLSAVDGIASPTATLSTPGYLVLGTAAGVASVSTLMLISPAVLTLSAAAGIATAAATVITLTDNELSLSPVAGVATVTGALSTSALLALSTVPGVATAALALQSPTALVLSPVAGVATSTLAVISPALMTLAADGLSTAAMTLSTEALLVLSAAAGVATATNNITSQVLFTMAAAGVATAAATLISPVNLTLSTAAGLSNSTLTVISPALFTLLADGLSTASLAVMSPALFTLTSGGVAVPTMGLSSPANLTLSAIDGIATALLSELSLGPSTKARIGSGYAPIVRITGGTIRPVIIQAGSARPVRINGGY